MGLSHVTFHGESRDEFPLIWDGKWVAGLSRGEAWAASLLDGLTYSLLLVPCCTCYNSNPLAIRLLIPFLKYECKRLFCSQKRRWEED